MFKRIFMSNCAAGACTATCVPFITSEYPRLRNNKHRILESSQNSLIYLYDELLAVADFEQQILFIKTNVLYSRSFFGNNNLSQTDVVRIKELLSTLSFKDYNVKYISPEQLRLVAFNLTQKYVDQFKDTYEI